MTETTRPPNRLIHATSPYLLQHAHNPVDWYEWGEEAFARARAEDKPVLLSIGYSACHWCHVMAHESFEDDATAALMNAHFVNVKVDREERPDLDDIYMAATLALNRGQGGWPMTVFLGPDQAPFFAGTYYPPEDRWGRPGFPTLLRRIAELWAGQRPLLLEQAQRLLEHLQDGIQPMPGSLAGEAELRLALEHFAAAFDGRWGGFGHAPKFPPAVSLMLLLRVHRRFGDPRALDMVRRTLDGMARGGIYDHVGGGFCRYSTDERWLVPHFEKMLYDNALLARAYLEGCQVTAEPRHRRVAVEVLEYALREMQDPEGGFHSSTDADSEGEEGKFFVWTPAEIRAVLGDEDAALFCAVYDISDAGNWEGRSIPNTPRDLDAVAAELGVSHDEAARRLDTARRRVYEARRLRVAPGLDDKVLTAWNGLMIGALAEGYRVLGERRYLNAAARAADFVLATLRRPDGRLLRTWRAGTARLDAYLEDYAYLADGLIDLYEAGGARRYLDEARRLVERIRAGFAAPGGGFFSTAAGHESLILRHREGHDGATPSANAVAARACARLACHFDDAGLRAESERALLAYGEAVARHPQGFSMSLLVADLLRDGPVELAFVGEPNAPELDALRAAVARHYLPNRIAAHARGTGDDGDLPLLRGKTTVDGQPALYVCRGFACRQPVTDPAAVADALGVAAR